MYLAANCESAVGGTQSSGLDGASIVTAAGVLKVNFVGLLAVGLPFRLIGTCSVFDEKGLSNRRTNRLD